MQLGWKLPEIVYSYNTAVQESSRHTPFEAMFGRQAKLPVDFNTEKEFDPDVKLEKGTEQPQSIKGCDLH